jgi:hypothetical protein
MYANVAIIVERAGTWGIPANAIINYNGQQVCYQVMEGRAVRTILQTGLRTDGVVEILQKQASGVSDQPASWQGIEGTEEIVNSNRAGLTNGQAARMETSGK